MDVERDYEVFDEYDIGSPLDVFWTKGHDVAPLAFVRAIVEHCLDEEIDIPRINVEDAPEKLWQYNIDHNGILEFHRSPDKPEGYHGREAFPVTVLDLEKARRRGMRKCSVEHCREPWSHGMPIRVLISPADSEQQITARIWLCRTHGNKFPEPIYRVFMVPVGATVVLDGALS
jgi:hypothetical protein